MTTNETRLKAIIEATPECIKIVSPNGTLTFMNQAGLDMIEATSFSQVEDVCVFDVISPDHRHHWIEMHDRVCQGERLNWQFEIVGLSGIRRYMETHAVPLQNPDGTISQLAVTRDITQKRISEVALKRNEIIIKGQKQALELAFHNAKLSDILDVLTHTIESQAVTPVYASILLADQEKQLLFFGSAPSLSQEYNDSTNNIPIAPNTGSCGTAAYTKKEVIVSDIATDPLWSSFKHLALKHGLRACWSLPILSSNDKLLATIAIYYTMPQMPTHEDRKAVELLSRTAGLVIERLDEIAHRKKAEEDLQVTDRHLRALITASSEVLYRMNADWSQMLTLDGRSFLTDTKTPTDNWLAKYIVPQDQRYVRQIIDKAIKEKTVFQLEHRVQRIDGTVGWVFSRAIPILDSHGKITEWFGTASDISESKESEAKFRRFYESDMLPIAFWETSGKVYDCNNAFSELIGLPKESIINGEYDWLNGAAKEYSELHKKNVTEAIESKAFVKPYEMELVRPDGNHIFVLTGYTMLEGSAEKAVAFVMDITVQQSMLSALEYLVVERTKELNQVNHALQQSNQDLLQFAHVASHDLKEPVRKIKTFGNRLQEELKEEKGRAKEYLNKIMASASRMTSMIDGVLSYSTVNASPQEIDHIDLNKLFTDILDDLEVSIVQRSAKVILGKLPSLEANHFLVYQLFYNLVNNSLKFTDPLRETLIEVEASTFSREGSTFLSVVIKDNGIGFEQANSERIFETFTRLNPKDKYEGTGLGLALCKKIVERYHGSITAFGQLNKGASFIVTLPLQISNPVE